jgi:hypothetical protein
VEVKAANGNSTERHYLRERYGDGYKPWTVDDAEGR